VALIARDETGLQETRQACERFGIKTLAISADVADAGALQRAAAEVEATLGAIDVWINNAMTTVLAPFRQMSEEEFRRVTEVTYLGYVNGTRAALEVMRPGIGGDYSGRLGAGLAFESPAVGLLRSESGDPRLYRCRAYRTDA
jgi:NAD(P)-dependent dehydrogenase (short-subunit alcohol dehydrogenase family)